MSKKVTIRIGDSLKKQSAGQVKAILTKRYPNDAKEIEAVIERHFGKDEGAAKLTADGNIGADKSEPKGPKK
jgi:hypothetical protein